MLFSWSVSLVAESCDFEGVFEDVVDVVEVGDFETFCNDLEILQETSSPYFPQSNGLADSAVKNYDEIIQIPCLPSTMPYLPSAIYQDLMDILLESCTIILRPFSKFWSRSVLVFSFHRLSNC